MPRVWRSVQSPACFFGCWSSWWFGGEAWSSFRRGFRTGGGRPGSFGRGKCWIQTVFRRLFFRRSRRKGTRWTWEHRCFPRSVSFGWVPSVPSTGWRTRSSRVPGRWRCRPQRWTGRTDFWALSGFGWGTCVWLFGSCPYTRWASRPEDGPPCWVRTGTWCWAWRRRACVGNGFSFGGFGRFRRLRLGVW